MKQDVLLQMTDICKEFPGVKALDHVSLTVKAGTVHALMGENGAGKSTLMKIIMGIYTKDAGKVILDGKEVEFKSAREALDAGIKPYSGNDSRRECFSWKRTEKNQRAAFCR